MGVIVKVDRDVFTIIDPYGNITRVGAQQIKNKRDTSRAVTSDVNGNPITCKDPVLVLDENGTDKKQATVLHIYRSFVFLKSKDIVENNGVFVAKSTNVALLSTNMTKPSHLSFQRPIGRPGRVRDSLNGKTVTITGGPFKGYLGIVKDTAEAFARVELHTNNQTISVDKSRLTVVGEGLNSRPNYGNGHNMYSYENAKTPMHGMGAKTPMHSMGSDRDQNSWNSGSRTPAWNAGSKTPAWDSGSKTPAWDSGSKTPVWDSGSRTPAVGRSSYKDRYSTPSVPNTPGFQESTADTLTPFHPTTPAAFPSTPGTRQTPGYPNMASVAPTPKTPYDVATPNPATPAVAPRNDYYRSSTGY